MTKAGIGRGWRRGALAAIAAAAFVVPAPAAARDAVFAIGFSGHGHYTGHTTGHVTNQDGRCTNFSDEDTTFSFVELQPLHVKFNRTGMSGDAADQNHWTEATGNPSTLKSEDSGPGCYTTDTGAGTYECSGTALPSGKSHFDLPAVQKGDRTHLSITGPFFLGDEFSGPFTYQSGGCADNDQTPLFRTMFFHLPSDLGVRFPIKEHTLRTLPVGHHFKLDVGEGIYAPHVNDAHRCAENTSVDTCQQTFDWGGRVNVKRIS